ncbi:MAG: cytochrome c oxidase subunit II [Acidimicrobiia bacterium]|nr:cytochrome c oxidase subunit II [Acidimicrobiia bacterium]
MTQPKSRIASRITAPLVVAGLAVLLGACGNSNRQNSLDPKGPAAEKIDNLFIPILFVAIVIGVLVIGATVVMAIKFRQRGGQPGNPKQIHGHTALEIGWTIVPALILAVVAVPTVATIWDLAERPTGPDVLKVQADGSQWWWQFELPNQPMVPQASAPVKGNSATGPVLTSTELHIPVGVKVDVALNSEDVIHSFWVPELAGKKDVMPARTNHVTIEASKPGTFLGACAEYCGLSHADMRFRVIAQPMNEWKAWLADISGPPAQPYTGAIQELTTNTYQCTNCHVFDNVHTINYGPNLTHLGTRSTFAGGTYEVNRKNLMRWVQDAPSMIAMQSTKCRIQPPPPGVICTGMPSFTKNTPPGAKVMTTEDAATIVDYLLKEK